jgi:ABC-type polysaccharide/polyol phosphate export permease
MDALDIAVRGFLMPVYALVDGVMTYTVNQVVIAFQNASQTITNGANSSGLPSYAIVPICFAIMGFMMTASGYFQDLSGYLRGAAYGLSYPIRAIVYRLE